MPVVVAGKEYRWTPYEFSLRWGIEGKPGEQGFHGLKEIIHDEFFDVPNDKPGSVWYFWTGARCPQGRSVRTYRRRTPAERSMHGWTGRDAAAASPLDIRRANTRMLVRLTQAGKMPVRAYAVLCAMPPPRERRGLFLRSQLYLAQRTGCRRAFFRKDFTVRDAISQARLRITCGDQYTVYLNGQEVGRGDRASLVQQYDVRTSIKNGRNVICVRSRNTSGLAGLIAELVMVDWSGSKTSVATDASWRCVAETQPAWLDPAFDDSKWPAAVRICGFENSPWCPTEPGTNLRTMGSWQLRPFWKWIRIRNLCQATLPCDGLPIPPRRFSIAGPNKPRRRVGIASRRHPAFVR